MISKEQIKLVKTLERKLSVQDMDALVIGYSGGRTKHVSELETAEARALIQHLKGLDPDEVKADKMRKKMIALAYEYHGVPKTAGKGKKMEAIKHLEAWVLKYGHGGKSRKHKQLNAYTVKELPMLLSQMEKVYKEHLQQI